MRSARAFTGSVLAWAVQRAVRTPVGLRAVNQLHRRLGLASQRRFFYHSLKFLAHGVRVVSFEPNPACHPFFMACCERNGLTPELHGVAVGARTGTVELAIPGDQT